MLAFSFASMENSEEPNGKQTKHNKIKQPTTTPHRPTLPRDRRLFIDFWIVLSVFLVFLFCCSVLVVISRVPFLERRSRILPSNPRGALARPVRGAEELAMPLRRATGGDLELWFHNVEFSVAAAAKSIQPAFTPVALSPQAPMRFAPLAAPLPTTTMAPARRPPWGRERGAAKQLDLAGNPQLRSEYRTGSMLGS